MAEVRQMELDGDSITVVQRSLGTPKRPEPVCYLGHEPVLNGYIVIPDTNMFLKYGDGFVEALNKEHPGKVWLTKEIRREVGKLVKSMKKEERPNILDSDAFLCEMYRKTSLLNDEPFGFPEYKKLDSCGEKGVRAKEKLERLAKESSSRDPGAKEPSPADQSLFIPSVYGNSDFGHKSVIMSDDNRVIYMADALNREGYGIVFARSMKDVKHYVREFL